MVAVESFYGVGIGRSDWSAASSTAEVLEVFEFLKPKAAKTPLLRIGGDVDGSYLVPDDFEGITACFSPGVNRIKYFEDFLADHYGIRSHMCDFSCDVEQFTTPLKPGMQTFEKKWLDVNAGADNISLEDWIREHDVGGDLLLQMDIEGAEYRNILATPKETLARFRVIVLELHRLGRMLDEPILREAIAPFMQKLADDFTTVHAHPNNCCGEFRVPGTDIAIPDALEITLLRNDRFVPAPGPAALPHPLDVSRNVSSKPPLHLSEAWCDHQRPLESRVKLLEDILRYHDDVQASRADPELSAALSMTMLSLQTLTKLAGPAPAPGDLVEIAGGRPYELSSAFGGSSKTGVVQPRESYFFHTDFGQDQSIKVDLGRRRQIRRIEVTNRQGGFQERAKHMFAVLSDGESSGAVSQVFPMFATGTLPGGAWQECGVDLPEVSARYVTITSPTTTALHFSDLRIYAPAPPPAPVEPTPRWTPQRILLGVKRRLRRLRARANSSLGRAQVGLNAATRPGRPPAGRG